MMISILSFIECLLGITVRKSALFLSFAKKRKIFEDKNLVEAGCKPFKNADIAFHFSSEGEFEQIYGILENFIEKNKKIELIFTSPSVEKKVIEFQSKFPHLIRYLRYPFLKKTKLSTWVSAKNICMVRYDFFPEILALKLEKRGNFILLAGNFKKVSKQSVVVKFIYRQILSFFDVVVCNTYQDERILKMNLGYQKKTMVADFRIPRIVSRVVAAPRVCREKWAQFEDFSLWLQGQPKKKIVWGSAWLEDLKALYPKNEANYQHIIVPHQLDEKALEEMQKYLSTMTKVHLYRGGAWASLEKDIQDNPGVVILAVKGILCELYQQFDFAYVGGGFTTSIHSVLEPFLSRVPTACGPLIHRSTEFDQIKDAYRALRVLGQPEDFVHFLAQHISKLELEQAEENLVKKFTSQNSQVLEILGT
jgi:3-deoxy-D-manno-octulosonic-acid transferase